jgi:hypothetical protein
MVPPTKNQTRHPTTGAIRGTAVRSNGEATDHRVPQKMTTPVAEARIAVGKLSSQKIIDTEYSKVPDLMVFSTCFNMFRHFSSLGFSGLRWFV